MSQAIPHIGAALRYVRHTLRLKIELVAQDAGCAPSNLSRIENGRQQPSVPLLQALAQALGTPVSELYALVEAEANPTKSPSSAEPVLNARDWIDLRRKLEAISPTRREELLSHLEALHEAQLLDRRLAGQAALNRAMSAQASPAPMADPQLNPRTSTAGGTYATAVPLAPLSRS